MIFLDRIENTTAVTGEDVKFPINPFEDVLPSDFGKLNKKHVSEDFVAENFARLKWDVLRPFNDTGIDIVIVKSVCKNGHTKLNENLRGNTCPSCETPSVEITRFLQVKTSSISKGIFKLPLKSKDIRKDPRHVLVLYSDKTGRNKQDIFMISVYAFLRFLSNIDGKNPFATTSFRTKGVTMNKLRYNKQDDKWKWLGCDWESYRNESGLYTIQSPATDLDLLNYGNKITDLANSLQRQFTGGQMYSSDLEDDVNNYLQEKLQEYKSPKRVVDMRKKSNDQFKSKNNPEIVKSRDQHYSDWPGDFS